MSNKIIFMKNDNNRNSYKNEQQIDLNNDINIKLKSPIREIIKKLIKNKNQINESFSNYFNMSNGLHNKSYDFKNNNNSKSPKIIDKIKKSGKLKKYFSDKYGGGDFNIFLNKYNLNKINHEIIGKELDIIIENNNNNNNNNTNNIKNYIYKSNLVNSKRFIKRNKNNNKTSIESNKKKKLKNNTIDQMNKIQKIYKTETPSNRDTKKSNNQRNNNNIMKYFKNRNFSDYQNAWYFVTNFSQTDAFNNKIKEVINQNSINENIGSKPNIKNTDIYTRNAKQINDANNFTTYSFL